MQLITTPFGCNKPKELRFDLEDLSVVIISRSITPGYSTSISMIGEPELRQIGNFLIECADKIRKDE